VPFFDMRQYDLNRYSRRLPWSTPPNVHSSLLKEKRRAGIKLLDLTAANPTEALADYPHKEIGQAYGALDDFRYEPQAFGTAQARGAIANWHAGHGIPVEEDRIALTASTSEAYAILFKLLCDPGDEVLIPQPSYPLFEFLARAEGVKTVPYRLAFDGGWFLDFDSLRRAISPRSKAIVVVNPNNPTGSFLKLREVEELTALAAAHRCALISDEVFMTYPCTPAANTVRSLIGNDGALTFSLNGLSKEAGMPQMKLGWMVLSGPGKAVDCALAKLELLLDTYLSVGTPVQSALEALLRIGSGIHTRIDLQMWRNRETLGILRESAVRSLPSEGGWSAILQVPNVLTEDIWINRLLDEHGVVLQPGYFYDMSQEAYLVVSLLVKPEDFTAGIGALKQLADRL
jgi:alanine-synthesizing transaminase